MESLLEQSDVVRRKGRRWRKIRNMIFLVICSGFMIGGTVKYYVPCAEGVKSGKLNYVVYRGVVFKTYEGKLIQSGAGLSGKDDGMLSGEFVFSVAGRGLAEKLIHAGGKVVEVHYTKYWGAIPWRGHSRYVVDEIVSVTEEEEMPEVKEPEGSLMEL